MYVFITDDDDDDDACDKVLARAFSQRKNWVTLHISKKKDERLENLVVSRQQKRLGQRE